MIKRLQRKMMLISTVAVLCVLFAIFLTVLVLNLSVMNRNFDALADRVFEGGGRFPGATQQKPSHGDVPPKMEYIFDFITSETPFSTRHFTVLFDNEGKVVRAVTESIFAIDDQTAVEYAKKAASSRWERGWISNYRYKIYNSDTGTEVVFIDGSSGVFFIMRSMTIVGAVMLISAALILVLIFLLSKKAIRPIAESYEKQKQFITDANHELKTPLTLIMANAEIAELELGKNEWLDDIRAEGERMNELVNQLVALSRMDEEENRINMSEVPLGRLALDTVAEFEPVAKKRGKSLVASIDEEISCLGDEALLRRLIGILLDNAVKYCDGGGEITVTLRQARRVLLTVENTYFAVNELELDRLFDRFFRADKARSFTGGYGVGLAMAKSIVQNHKGDITAYKRDDSHIGFKVVL